MRLERTCVVETLNHMGEREYQTYSGWKRACKIAHPGCTFRGDKDIGGAVVDGKDVGEWGGDVGSVFVKKPAVKEAVDALLSEDETTKALPPVEELFRIFSEINLDCSKSKQEQVVSFDDVDYYDNQISCIWEEADDNESYDAAVALKDYAKDKGYVLP